MHDLSDQVVLTLPNQTVVVASFGGRKGSSTKASSKADISRETQSMEMQRLRAAVPERNDL
jgi:hypothetical protein